MKSLPSKLMILCCLLSSLGGLSCLRSPAHKKTASKSPPLALKGSLLSSRGSPGSNVAIYIEDEVTPETTSSSDGKFQLTLTAARMATLQRKYEIGRRKLRIYFELKTPTATGNEAAVLDKVDFGLRGSFELGKISLQPLVKLSGSVVGSLSPETTAVAFVGTKVKIGRATIKTGSDGRFTTSVPQSSSLPVTAIQSGFVETHGIWPSGTVEDSLVIGLYPSLAVEGQLLIPSSFRKANPEDTNLDLGVYANSLARWVRIASEPSILESNNLALAPWRSTDQPLQIPMFGQTASYSYQFADQDLKNLSPIYSLTASGSGL